MFEIFEEKESQVRSYCRHFPVLLDKAVNAELFTADGKRYLDFLAGAGAINYGHNNPYIKKAIVDYLSEDNILHALDLFTVAKQDFLKAFNDIILKPKGLDYKVMCCGATGTNAVEAALKLARKNTKRQHVIAFHGAFHGMTTGALACTGERFAREGAGVPLNHVTFVPYSHQIGGWQASLDYLNYLLEDDHSGVPMPAAIILETVQAEGGINVAEVEWLRGIREICDKYGIIMIVDDIQVGNCRSGKFFSFERAGIVPDLVTLSKSISGLGMPMSLLLMRPQYDIFGPAEHNGTWRGNQLAFVGAKAGFEYYRDHQMEKMVAEKEAIIKEFMDKAEYFTVMAFDVEQSKVLNYMGTKSGRDEDKAQALGLHTAYTANGTPYYTEAAMVIECKIMYAAPFEPQYFKSDAPKKMYANFPAGIHSMYIGEVINAWKK